MSVRRVTARSIAAGSIFPFSPGGSRTFVPFAKNSGAPHSETSTCAISWQRMLWYGWQRDGSDNEIAERRERQRIGRRAVEHQEHFTLRFEDVADEVGRLRGPCVVAITDFMPGVGLRERREGFGADAGVVVAGEMAGFGIFFHVLPEVLT